MTSSETAAPKVEKTAAKKYEPGDDVQNIVVCCDGSWCGELTGTTSNIKILANSFADGNVASLNFDFDRPESATPAYNATSMSVVGFFDGIGTSSSQVSFADYLIDGAIAVTIRDRCVEAYRFIAEHFQPGKKVYLFGLSRGAHTVRSVAAMINNFGIIRFNDRDSCKTESDLVYTMYCDRDDRYRPASGFSTRFKQHKSHVTTEPPIRFMGLLDTVGALGVPQLNPGSGPTYEFIDQVVSWQVQTVCQALAVHDRMSLFSPCFATRKGLGDLKALPYSGYPRSEYKTKEVWFPGSHYDIGRQRLVIARKGKRSWEALFHTVQNYTNLLQLNVAYTPSLADPPLLWMIKNVKGADARMLRENANYYLEQWKDDIIPEKKFLPRFPETYTDAYDKLYKKLVPNLLRFVPIIGSWVRVILNSQLLMNRFVPQDPKMPAACFYKDRYMSEEQARVQYNKYISRTFQNFENIDLRDLEWESAE